MKKLLALVLCVMMFVSIIPTSAFAEEILTLYPWIDTPIGSAAAYKKEIKDMIKNTREEIEGAYAVMAADKSIYNCLGVLLGNTGCLCNLVYQSAFADYFCHVSIHLSSLELLDYYRILLIGCQPAVPGARPLT